MLFDAGAAEVHVRISSPPVVSPCFYGIDLASEDEMIAAHATVEEVREAIGATSLAYLSLEGCRRRRAGRDALCRACLTREYPTRVPADAAKLRFEPRLATARDARRLRDPAEIRYAAVVHFMNSTHCGADAVGGRGDDRDMIARRHSHSALPGIGRRAPAASAGIPRSPLLGSTAPRGSARAPRSFARP